MFVALGAAWALPQDFKKDPVKKDVKIEVLDVISVDAVVTIVQDESPGYSWQDIENILTINFENESEQPAEDVVTFKDEGIPSKGYMRHWQPGNSISYNRLRLLLSFEERPGPDIV